MKKLNVRFYSKDKLEKGLMASILNTLRSETFTGRNFHEFHDFWVFSRKLIP